MKPLPELNGAELTKAEYDELNARRHALIEQRHSGFTEEEQKRPFADHPGWKEECERRHQANLTAAERDELEQLQRITGEYLNHHFPLPELPDLDDLMREWDASEQHTAEDD